MAKVSKINEKTPTLGEMEEFVLKANSDESLAKASMAAAYSVQQMFDAGETLPTPRNTDEWIGLYADHVWAYAGIYAIMSTIAQLDFKLSKRTKATGELVDIPSHKILDLLKDPNDSMTGYDLLESLVVYEETCGKAYWEIIYGKETTVVGGKTTQEEEFPIELYPIIPSRLTPEPGKDGKGVARYVFQTKKYAKKEFFNPENIVPFKYFHPLNEWDGLGSLQPAIDDIKQDKQMASWNLDFFKHGITPEGILTTPERMTPKETEDLGKQIRSFLTGKGRQVLILSKNLTWETISVNPKDIDFLGGRSENRQAMLAALGVPPVKVGLLEHAKYDNYMLQLEAFYRDTIIPKVKKIEGSLQNFLLIRFPDLVATDEYEYTIEFDKTLLTKEDEDKLVNRFTKMIEFGLMTPNEARQKLDMEPWAEGNAGGDAFYMKTSLVQVGLPTEESLAMREDMISRRLDSLESELREEFADIVESLSSKESEE